MKNLIDDYIRDLEDSGKNTQFTRLLGICEDIFGDYRVKGSHHIFKTPWPGDPRINLQPSKGGKVKGYQVKQVIRALQKRRDQLG